MAKLNRFRFLLFASLMIFPAHALRVFLSGAREDFKQQSEININIIDGGKVYLGTSDPLSYEAEPGISKIIVYIIGKIRFFEIFRHSSRNIRLQTAEVLKQTHRELIFLGMDNFDGDEYGLISAFMVNTIRSHQNQINITIETIGENHFDHFYQGQVGNIEKYEENAEIYGGNLLAHLRSMPYGAFETVGSNEKEIKLYHGFVRKGKEVSWPVNAASGKYLPGANLNFSDPEYNLGIKHSKKKIYLLILGGKEYSALLGPSVYGRTAQKAKIKGILDSMTKAKEALFILGAFNFDWAEMNIIPQIILKHTEGEEIPNDNVYTYGYGMFNTHYRNVYDTSGKTFRRVPNSYALEAIRVLMGEEPKQRSINVHYSDNGGCRLEIPINLSNGKYVGAEQFDFFTLSSLNQKIAVIVYDQTELKGPVDDSKVSRYVKRMQRSNISVVFIEAINFGFQDKHIIAEWIDVHRGTVNPEQIAVLGGGIFDTIFQSDVTTFNTFLDIKKNEMKIIRSAYVKGASQKRVFAANIDGPNFEVWSYPMNTVNGFYEPDLMSDKHMFKTKDDKRKILFIITSAYFFNQISTFPNLESATSLFRRSLMARYPISDWSVLLVGLDNFGENDCHLFPELVKTQTQDERSLVNFVSIFRYYDGMDRAVYQYKDTEPFAIAVGSRIQSHIVSFFGLTCRFPDGTPLPTRIS